MVVSKSEMLLKILREFMIMWALTGVGMLIGSMLPPVVALIMSILSLVLIISTYFIKDLSKVNKIFYGVPFLMGFSFYYSVSFFLQDLGKDLVLGVLLLTVVMFLGLGFLGYVSIKANLGNLGKFLLIALLILVVLSIIGIFSGSYLLHFIIAVAGITIFALYTIYDFNMIQHNDIQSNETTGYALSLYLNFINLFLHLLKLVRMLNDNS